jgi:hypothetical protein
MSFATRPVNWRRAKQLHARLAARNDADTFGMANALNKNAKREKEKRKGS